MAAAIETLFADRLDEFFGLLAYHYSKAEDWEKAQEYLFKAADQAGSIAADAEALAHYEQAMAAHVKVFGDSWDPTERAVLERKLGEALYRLGRFEEARTHLVRAMALLGCPVPESRAALRWALAKEVLIQASHRLMAAVLGRVPVAPTPVYSAEYLRTYDVLMFVEFPRDPIAGAHLQLLTLNLAERNGDGQGAAVGSCGVAFVLDAVPVRRLAGLYMRNGLALVGEETAPEVLATVIASQGTHEFTMGEWADAEHHWLEAADKELEAGDLYAWAAHTALATLLMIERGDFPGALRLGEEEIARARESGDPMALAAGLAAVGHVLLRQGALIAADERLAASYALLVEAGVWWVATEIGGHLADGLLRMGRVSDALALLEECQERIRRHGMRGFPCRWVWTGLAEAKLAVADGALGPPPGDALAEAKQSIRRVFRHARGDKGAYLRGYRLRGVYHHLRGHPRRARRDWEKGLELARELGARYEEGAIRLEIGRRLGDRAQLELAEALFADMGAEFYLAETKRALAELSGAATTAAAPMTATGVESP